MPDLNGSSQAVFVITLAEARQETIVVKYETKNGTAVAGVDFLYTKGEVTFLPGETEKTISITVYATTTPGKTFSIKLDPPVNGILKTQTIDCTIRVKNSQTGAVVNVVAAQGTPGVDGTDGVDGREPEMQKGTEWIQWRHKGTSTWNNLVRVADLKGAKGDAGASMTFRGNWQSGNTYSAPDYVTALNGSAEASVFIFKGAAPLQSTTEPKDDTTNWVEFSAPAGPTGAQGPAGPKGDAGDAGPAGPKGDTGDTGPAGPQGPAGADGADGATGAQGPAGDTGPAGPTGPQGPVGDPLAYVGAWQAGDYDPGEAVRATNSADDGDALWVMTDATTYSSSTEPKDDATHWLELPGIIGPQGDAGATGATGPAGPAGPTGPQGPAGEDGTTANRATNHVDLNTDFGISSDTLADVTGFNWTLTAGKLYWVKMILPVKAGSTSIGLKLSLSATAGKRLLALSFAGADNDGPRKVDVTEFATDILFPSFPEANKSMIIVVEGFLNCTGNGTVKLQAANNGTGYIALEAGAFAWFEEIA